MAYGCAAAAFVEDLSELMVRNWPIAGPIVMAHLMALPMVVIGVVLGRQPPPAWRVLLVAVWVVIGLSLGGTAASLVKSEGFGVGMQAYLVPLRVGIVMIAYWAFASLLMLIGWWLARRLFGVPLEQTDPPRYCWVCAYERGQIDPCPECGTPAAAARPPLREAAAWRLARLGATPALALLAVGFAGYAAWRVSVDTLPTLRFVQKFDAERGWTPTYAYIDHIHGADSRGLGGRYLNATGFTRELGDGSGRMILVSYRALVPGDLPVMQVRMCAEATLPLGWPPQGQRMTDWGSPGTIVADLNREQAEQVLKNGVPQGLIDAIVAEADRVGWKPWGGMQSGGTRIEIDPAPHFAVKSNE
ncbi:MAG: hypothetical protein KF699_02195 [Phycisphaeraceae bacterium]|nr:hypothetical protein [Phycisphaeraceae bacterium]